MISAETQDRVAAALKIDGWLTSREAGTLYDLARKADGPIVEIGSWQGRSTAAIALGSMAGAKNTVYAIDPFIGPQEGARPTSLGNITGECSPTRLRANLDAAGVNGLVRIVPKRSEEAASEIPNDCALIFIDGAHDYDSVARDIDLYMPKLKLGGHAVFHDVHSMDMGVVEAFDDRISSKPESFLVVGRVDSAVVVKKVNIEKRQILLACPGKSWGWGTINQGIVQASLGAHEVRIPDTAGGTGWDDFNALWAVGLNMAEAGEITHFAMLHSDIVPCPGWLDTLMVELEDRKADLVSTAIPIKDRRGLTSCGVGEVSDPWSAYRRFTMHELMEMPETFGIADTPHPDKVLLHNTGCWVCDLRRPLFFETKADGSLKCFFDFPTRVIRVKGKWERGRESEDWFFSRQLHAVGAKTFITRKVRLSHQGNIDFVNWEPWGTFKDDEDTRERWSKK